LWGSNSFIETRGDRGRIMSKGNAGGDLRRFYIIFAAVALVGIGWVGYSVGSEAVGKAVSVPVDLGDLGGRELMELAVPVIEGNPDAPVSILVFGDFNCPACGGFSLTIRPEVVQKLVDTGRARLVFYDFPLPQYIPLGSFLAARAARCAGDQGGYWEYHDYLFQTQRIWSAESDHAAVFQDYAEAMGLDADQFRGCLNSDRHAQDVTANQKLAEALGIMQTPSVLVGAAGGVSQRLGEYSFQAIEAAVEDVIRRMNPSGIGESNDRTQSG
jgi:protein-disulfide isomerase